MDKEKKKNPLMLFYKKMFDKKYFCLKTLFFLF